MDYKKNSSVGGHLMISIEQPRAFAVLLILVPAVALITAKFAKLKKSAGIFYGKSPDDRMYRRLRRALILRTALRILALICAVLAFSGLSWGTKKIPVLKSGNTVSFVFDISYSMTAKDCGEGRSRLETVKIYARNLLARMQDASFSAVLAKGDGFIAIPMTEDRAALETLIENLSPALMTSAGSSIGRGIEAAITSFSSNSSKNNYIWVFTDGDETDNQLEKALEAAATYGISVALVGFGSEAETEIISGDGKTPVKTALRAKKLASLAETTAGKKISFLDAKGKSSRSRISYTNAAAESSAWQLLSQLNKTSGAHQDSNMLSYEVQNVHRHTLFLFLAVVFFMLSFFAGEFRFFLKNTAAALILCGTPALFCSCSAEQKGILDGTWAWYKGTYQKATADFLRTYSAAPNESPARPYALFGLAATYMSLGEYDAAMERLMQIQPDDETIPGNVRSAAFYNAGIISERENEYTDAAEFFKKAILADSTNTNAKINLELCQRQLARRRAHEEAAELTGANETNTADNSQLKNEIFNLIRKKEDEKWKNMQSDAKPQSILDY